MNNKYKRLLDEPALDHDFWPSFTDLLATILLVILLFLMAIIVNQQVKAEQREVDLTEKELQIEQQEELINYLTGIRKDIILELENEFAQTDLDIEIDKETGSIKFRNDLLFETGKHEIRPAFKKELQTFIPKYFTILYGKYSEYISDIVVEGHTDDVGSFMYNLDLSQKRAFSVVKYILSDEIGHFPYKELVQNQLTANGRSESQLKYFDDGTTVDREKSRRVEFKFRLKNYANLGGVEQDVQDNVGNSGDE